MKTIIKIAFLSFVMAFLLLGCAKKSEDEYIEDARRHLQANDMITAEKIYKNGLLKYPDSSGLKKGLFEFYANANKWNEAENYYRIADIGFSVGTSIPGQLASHYFESKDWSKAYEFYSDVVSTKRLKRVKMLSLVLLSNTIEMRLLQHQICMTPKNCRIRTS